MESLRSPLILTLTIGNSHALPYSVSVSSPSNWLPPTRLISVLPSNGILDRPPKFKLNFDPLHFTATVSDRRSSAFGMFNWDPALPARFTVVRLADGAVVGRFKAPACFSYHAVNCAQDGDKIILDLCCYDKVFYDDLTLEQLRHPKPAIAEKYPAQLRRFTLDLAKTGEKDLASSDAEAEVRILVNEAVEFPRIHPGYRFRADYRYTYGVSLSFRSGLIKADMKTGTCLRWAADSATAVSEPIFVARPGGDAEDDGVILVVVLEESTARSFLVILNGSDLKELARAALPHHVPMGLHGFFWGS